MKKSILKIFTELFRHHISAVLIITLANMILTLTGSYSTICFSFLLPQRLLVGGEASYISTGLVSFRYYSIALIVICFALLILCLLFSYRRPGWLICAAAIMFVDISVGVWLLFYKDDLSYLIDIGVHCWIIGALTAAYFMQRAARFPVKAPSKAPKITPETANVTQATPTGIVFAMEDEARQVLRLDDFEKNIVNGYSVYSRPDSSIIAAVSGMGKMSAGAATSILISKGCRRIVNIGTCGCTGGRFAPGELVLPNVFYDGDFDLSMMDISTKDPAGVNTAEVENPIPCYTYSTFVTDHRADDGIVEMEAYAVVSACRAHNVPVTVVKIISDGGDVDEFEGNVNSVISRHIQEIINIIEQ